MSKKYPFIINLKLLYVNIDEYIKEYYTKPITKFITTDNNKIELISNIIKDIVINRSVKYEISKYNKIIIKDSLDTKRCIDKKYEIKEILGNNIFLTKNNKIIIIKTFYYLEKNNIVNEYKDIISKYKILSKLNMSFKLIDSYICSDEEYKNTYGIFILDYSKDYISLDNYIRDNNIKESDLIDIRNKLYNSILKINKNKDITLNYFYDKNSILVSKKNKDIKFILLDEMMNIYKFNEKNIRRNINNIITKNENNTYDNNETNITNYISKRLIDNKIISIEL